ncbi:protein kinase [[Phormidium] sp. ETS-05]|uniref:serine/threonine-protein kinase n=1 Tax=[Phormidium] sp. ETS-05 TaxID=222819 RepID=UPI0018EECBFF|nr:serine/threonine-protein kinase [[Phormidium] sp. ETS-05]
MLSPGTIINHKYQILSHIASGGFGDIYEIQAKNTTKILKVLNLQTVRPQYHHKIISLLQREAQVLSQLNHPGIPKLQAEDGYFTWQQEQQTLHCLVMAKISGKNLAQWLHDHQNQPISVDQAIDWLKQLTEILHEIHRHHYFHRDIKPENIMVQPDGKLVLIDFGAVREITNTYIGKLSERQEVTILISQDYTPLEQIKGQSVPQSDFFALGRTMVHLLTGVVPSQLPKDDATDELLWRKQAANVSPALADLIDEMMGLFPSDRPQSTTIILQRLAAINHNFSLAKSTPPQRDIKKPQLMRRRMAMAACLFCGIITWPFVAPKIAVACNKLGVELHKDNRVNQAEFYYQCALLFKSDYAKAHYNLGYAYEQQQKRELADIHYKIAMEYGNAAAHSNFGRLLVLDKNCQAALPFFFKGLELATKNSVKYALLANMGRAQMCQQLYQEARYSLEKAIALAGERPEAHCLLAPVLEALGDRSGTVNKLDQCPGEVRRKLPELDRWLIAQTRDRLLQEQKHR